MPGPQKVRIGNILKKHHQLTAEQISAILTVQDTDGRPFGQLAQQMFGLSTTAIEAAWAEQYLTYSTRVDLDTQQIDPQVLNVLSRRQAWQLQLLPLRREGDQLLVATCQARLVRSVNFVWRRLGEPVLILIASEAQLEAYLHQTYPWPAMQQRVSVREDMIQVG